MKPLFVLLSIFILSLVIIKFTQGVFDYSLAGRIAMAVMLGFTAIGHFAFTKGMTLMVPAFLPFKKQIVYLTGIFEIIAGVCLLIPSISVLAGWATILFFIVLLPGNIKAAMEHLDYEKGTYDGKGPSYLWIRVPMQVLFIGWVYVSAILG